MLFKVKIYSNKIVVRLDTDPPCENIMLLEGYNKMDIAFDCWHASIINNYTVDTYVLYFDIDNKSKKIKIIKSKRYEYEIDGDVLEYDLDFNKCKIKETEGLFEIKYRCCNFSITISEVKQQ
jgi:hypothetical protein